MARLDKPIGYQPACVEMWLEDQIEEKRHKRIAARVHPLFFKWAIPRTEGFKAANLGVSKGVITLGDLEFDRQAAADYVVKNYTMGPIASLILFTIIKAIITKLVFKLFDLCTRDPEYLVVYQRAQEEGIK